MTPSGGSAGVRAPRTLRAVALLLDVLVAGDLAGLTGSAGLTRAARPTSPGGAFEPAGPSGALLTVLAVLGTLAGVGLRQLLRSGRHRRAGDASAPVRDHWWLVPGLALAWPSAAITLDTHGPGTLLCYLLAVTVGGWLAGVDSEVQRLPNAVTLPAIPASTLMLGTCNVMSREPPAWGQALAGGIALGSAYLLLYVIGVRRGRGDIGLGDVKLALSLGQWLGWLGWPVLTLGAYLGALLSGLMATALVVMGRARRDTALPHGPSMIVGAWLAWTAAPFL